MTRPALYQCKQHQKTLTDEGIRQSTHRKKHPDPVVFENFFLLLKDKQFHPQEFKLMEHVTPDLNAHLNHYNRWNSGKVKGPAARFAQTVSPFGSLNCFEFKIMA